MTVEIASRILPMTGLTLAFFSMRSRTSPRLNEALWFAALACMAGTVADWVLM